MLFGFDDCCFLYHHINFELGISLALRFDSHIISVHIRIIIQIVNMNNKRCYHIDMANIDGALFPPFLPFPLFPFYFYPRPLLPFPSLLILFVSLQSQVQPSNYIRLFEFRYKNRIIYPIRIHKLMVKTHLVVLPQFSLCFLFTTVLDRGYFIFNLLCWSLDANIPIFRNLYFCPISILSLQMFIGNYLMDCSLPLVSIF